MSPRAPKDRKLANLIRTRVLEHGGGPANRVLFLGSGGEVLRLMISPNIRTPINIAEARDIAEELHGKLAAVVHLLATQQYEIQFAVVEVFDGSDSTIHGLVSSGTVQWIQIPPEVSDEWSRTWNRERKE